MHHYLGHSLDFFLCPTKRKRRWGMWLRSEEGGAFGILRGGGTHLCGRLISFRTWWPFWRMLCLEEGRINGNGFRRIMVYFQSNPLTLFWKIFSFCRSCRCDQWGGFFRTLEESGSFQSCGVLLVLAPWSYSLEG